MATAVLAERAEDIRDRTGQMAMVIDMDLDTLAGSGAGAETGAAPEAGAGSTRNLAAGPPSQAFPFQGEEEDVGLDDYEMVDPEFFAQIKEPAFTVNVDKTGANAASVRMLPKVDYVKYMINRREKRLVLKPCSEYDIRGFKWAREKDGRRYAAARTGRVFVMIICQVMGWNPDNRYRIIGRKIRARGEEVLLFDLARAKEYEKSGPGGKGRPANASAIPAGWNGRFGPTYREEKRSLQIDTFDGYTVFSVDDGKKAGDAAQAGAYVPAISTGPDAGKESMQDASAFT